MQVLYRAAADALVIFHAAYAATVVLGLVAILLGVALGWGWVRNFWFRLVHLSMIALVVAESLLGFTCPLTTWEKELRERAGQVQYEGEFLAAWVHELLFYEAPAWVFTTAYTLFGAAVLAAFLLAPPRWPWRKIATSSRGG